MTLVYLFGAIFVVFVVAMTISRSKQRQLRRDGIMPPKGEETMEDVRRLLENDRKIMAIKVYRTIHGVGLAEAKQAVDEMAGH